MKDGMRIQSAGDRRLSVKEVLAAIRNTALADAAALMDKLEDEAWKQAEDDRDTYEGQHRARAFKYAAVRIRALSSSSHEVAALPKPIEKMG